MKIIYRYLMGAIFRGYVLVAGALLALFGLFEFIDQAGDVGRATFSVADAVAVVALNLPARLVDLSPFVALLGVVYGLSTFVRSQELIAMRTVALAPLRLAVLSAVATVLFFLAIAGVELAARPMAQQAHLLHMTETSQDGTLFGADGIWIEHDGLFVSIESLSRGGAPSGIRMYQFDDDNRMQRFIHANRAELRAEGAWALRDVMEKRYLANGRVITRHVDSMEWTPTWRRTTALYELPVESLSLREVNAQRRYLAEEERPNALYALEFWRRLLTPLSGVVFALFAAPFVLGVGPRASMGGAVTLGVAVALGVFLLQQIGTNAIYLATQSAPLAVITPTLAVLGLATLLIRRVNAGPR
ncbi:MAG: LptF/LptG family permease [Pseudomonadales bacterium]